MTVPTQCDPIYDDTVQVGETCIFEPDDNAAKVFGHAPLEKTFLSPDACMAVELRDLDVTPANARFKCGK